MTAAKRKACGYSTEESVRRTARIVCGAGFAFCCVLGAVSHFFYEWSGGSIAAGIFFPANESVWEHMKLVFFPFFVYCAVALPLVPELNNRVFGAFAATYLAAATIPIVFYTYTAFTGRAVLAADISIFAAGTAAGWSAAYRAFTVRSGGAALCAVGAVGLAAVAACCLALTAFAPEWFLFIDPQSGKAGFQG